MSRKKAVAGGIGALSALLVSGVLLAPAAGAATAAGSGVNSAFAISASGLLTIKETPSVDDSDGFSQESLAKLDLPANLVSLHALNAQAGADSARASVADVSVGLGVGKPLLEASAIEAQCDGTKASSSLAKAKIGDVKLDVAVPANTGVTVPGVLSVTLNKQVTHKDGSVTVTAISINVDNIQKIDIASATCAPGDDGDGGGETPTSTKSSEPTKSTSHTPTSSKGGGSGSGSGDKATSSGKAPTPTPVKAHLDVTG